jgi:hypothetical protein
MDVQRNGGGPGVDRLHMAWNNEAKGIIEYIYYDDGVGFSSLCTPTSPCTLGGTIDDGPPHVTANDLGDVYVYTHRGNLVSICKLNGTSCDNGFQSAIAGGMDPPLFDGEDTSVQSGSDFIRTTDGYSIAASPTTSDRVMHCYQTWEDRVHMTGPKDIVCASGVFDEGTHLWTFSPAVGVGPQLDGHDQFMPSVSVTNPTYTWQSSISAYGEAYVVFYDRYFDPNNRLYRVNALKTVNWGLEWFGGYIDTTDSDPEYLPHHCFDSTERFIGDYAAVRASSLHTHGLYVAVPGASISTSIKEKFFSLGSWNN